MVLLRIPDLFLFVYGCSFIYNSVEIIKITDLEKYYDTPRILEMSDFIFSLNGIFQFIIFYFFNRNFRDSFNDIFVKK